VARAVEAVSVTTLLDSFAIGGVYTVLPRGGFTGRYARSPEKEQYAGTVSAHPTGLELPVGLPVRVLASGSYASQVTTAFLSEYCALYGASDPYCAVSAFTYTVHGLAPGPGVLRPYESGAGLRLAWTRTAGFYDQFYGDFPTAEFFRGVVPGTDTVALRELHFRRAGCCYYVPWGSAAWETYEGSWRFGVVPDDGARAELGEAPVLRLGGPRTDAPMTGPATFTVNTASGDAITATRWWYVRAASNVFDGEPVPMVSLVLPWGTIQVPRYPDGQRTVVEEFAACAGQSTCAYQATAAGAVVVQATLADGRVLAARNTGKRSARVHITADETTLTYGDTTVFRVSTSDASPFEVTGYEYQPLAPARADLIRAVAERAVLRATDLAARARGDSSEDSPVPHPLIAGTGSDAVKQVSVRRTTYFRDADLPCEPALSDQRCYLSPIATGYGVVKAVVAGEEQRDSVLVTVLPVRLSIRVPDGSVMRPSNETASRFFDSRRTVIVRVEDSERRPLGGRTVELVVSPALTSGGHNHLRAQSQLGNRPIGRIDGAMRVTTAASGEVSFTYIAPIVGGTDTLTARSSGADNAQVAITIAIPGLVAVATSGQNYFVRPTDNHSPQDNFAQPGVIEVVDSLFAAWKRLRAELPTKYPFVGENGRFSIDALALLNGGLFDISGNWRPSHFTHREGLDVDFNDAGNAGAEAEPARRWMSRLCEEFLFDGRPLRCVYEGTASRGPHYHIYFPNRFSSGNLP
jgi:hypothetical protein